VNTPEDFLAHDRHVVAASVEDRRLHEEPLCERALTRPPAAGEHPRALRPALLDVAEHLRHVFRRDERADLRRRIERIADPYALHPRREPVEERLAHARLHENARPVRAHLPGRVEVGE
jgi:hypothetical protein